MSEKIRILIADDSQNLRVIIRKHLETEFDMECFEAGNGEAAEQILQEQNALGESIDIIFLDWMMPKMTGFEFLMKIRSTEAFREKPEIIMLTAETYADQINACMRFGVSTYLTKPFTREDLVGAVRKILDQKKEYRYAV
jgi:DNA-binding response OmpR family regulator